MYLKIIKKKHVARKMPSVGLVYQKLQRRQIINLFYFTFE